MEVAACIASMEGFEGLLQEPLEAADHLSVGAYLGGNDNRIPKDRNARGWEGVVGWGGTDKGNWDEQLQVTGAGVCVCLGWGNSGLPPASSTALLGPLPHRQPMPRSVALV